MLKSTQKVITLMVKDLETQGRNVNLSPQQRNDIMVRMWRLELALMKNTGVSNGK